MAFFEKKIAPDFEALRRNILRQGRPQRVHYAELFQDLPIKDLIVQRFDLAKGLNPNDPFFELARDAALQAFLGYDTKIIHAANLPFPRELLSSGDTTAVESQRYGQRRWTDEHSGPIATWADFEAYPWPDPLKADMRNFEWAEKHLPEGMAVQANTVHIMEQPTWLMGYETLCIKLYEEPELIGAMFRRCGELYMTLVERIAAFPRVGVIWGSDDMGFKTGTLISPDHLRALVLPWHKKAAAIAHAHGKLYWLHSCGNLETIMDDLIDDVKIDAKHSFEDAIIPVTEMKRRYGKRVALLGGIDVDLLVRADEAAVRRRVRETLDVCMDGGGYCLGTGNSVANYIPVANYLAMLDEGRRYC